MNPFSVRLALASLVTIGHGTATKFGHPCSHLIDRAMVYPRSHTDLIQRIYDGQLVEFRLNGSGLKLYAHKDYNGLHIRIGGDQANLYPEFVFQANERLKELNLQRNT